MQQIKDVVDDLVVIVSMERKSGMNLIADKSRPILSRMRHLDVSHIIEGDDWFVLTGGTPDVVWPVRVGFAVNQAGGKWTFQVARSISPRDARGKVRLMSTRMLALDIVAMDPDGRCTGVTEILSWINGRWTSADGSTFKRHHDWAGAMPSYKGDADHFDIKGQIAIGNALRQRYDWSVSIGERGGPSFRFSTDATGVRELVKERDRGEAGRRDALKGWVVDHWRQTRNDPETEIYVRKHLRGGERFMWRGYECEWRPSEFDVEQNQKHRLEREMMGTQARRARSS